MSHSDNSLGIWTKVEKIESRDHLTQRGEAFFRYLLGSCVTIAGLGILADLPSRFFLGGFILAMPAVYVYVTRNYPAEFSESHLKELREDDDVISIDGHDFDQDTEPDQPESNRTLVENLARTKIRLKQYKTEGLQSKDELVEEIYDELADLGFYTTHDQIENWIQEVREDSEERDTE